MTSGVAGPGASPRSGARRQVVAYLATVVVLAWVVFLVWDPAATGHPIGATGSFFTAGWLVLAVLAIVLAPPATATLHLASRLAPASRPPRILAGALAYGGWFLFLAVVVVLAQTVGLWPQGFAVVLGLTIGAGATFAALAGPVASSPGSPVSRLAIGLAALIVVFCFVTAGWWGSPA